MNPLHSLGLHLYLWFDRCFPAKTLTVGAWGERWAARYLTLKGCHILERNVHPCRHGELDIVAKERNTYLFVEVKTRQHEAYGAPITAINARKRTLLRRCATHWLARHFLLKESTRYRFDAIEVVGSPGKLPEIRHVKRLDMTATRAPDL